MTHFHGYNKKHSYFEGWYLKHQTGESTFAIIPAYHIDPAGGASASLQIITPKESFMVPFPAGEFHAAKDHFRVTLGKNTFTEQGIYLDISTDHLYLQGKIQYGPWAAPSSDIMGPFRHIPFMQCNHGVLSYTHGLSGFVNLNGWIMNFTDGCGYIEKDWGTSFPSSYLWTQCNWKDESDKPCSMMLSIAKIPFLGAKFTGCIGTFFCGGKEYRLATYKGAGILELTGREAVVRQGDYLLHINLLDGNPSPLYAPSDGKMNRIIREHLCCQMRYQFFIRHRKVCDIISRQAGFESGGDEPDTKPSKKRRYLKDASDGI